MPNIAMHLSDARFRAWLPAGLAVAAAGVLSMVAVGAAKIGAYDAAAAQAPATSASSSSLAPEQLRFRNIAPQGAVSINAKVPVSALPNPSARPFFLAASTAADRERAVRCLTSAIYYEAATEPVEGQRAVAQVVLNRVRHQAYPNSVCGVVYQGMERKTGCQFTFTCDGSLARTPMSSYWNGARKVSEAALSGSVYAPVGWATHYHTNWVVPYWSSSLVKAAVVGTHIFYRWAGGVGTGAAFRTAYAGVEIDADMRRLASMGTAVAVAQGGPLLNLKPASPLTADALNAPLGGVSLHRAELRRYELARTAGGTSAPTTRANGASRAIPPTRRWALAREISSRDDQSVAQVSAPDKLSDRAGNGSSTRPSSR